MKIFETIKLKKWAKAHGIPKDILKDLLHFQLPKSVYIEAHNAMEPAPPLSYIGNIIRDNLDCFPMETPISQQMFVIGSCPNGDSVAIDLKEDVGSVWYIDHDQVGEAHDIRSISVRVSGSLFDYIEGYTEEDDFPLDYWDVIKESEPIT